MSIEISKIPQIKPGIQRDGTQFNSESYIDGQWCRFYLAKPRKIGGYALLNSGNNVIVRTVFNVSRTDNTTNVYLGRYNKVSYLPINRNNIVGIEVNRTPVAFPSNQDNLWQVDLMTVGIGVDSQSWIIAASIPNASSISTTDTGNIWYGTIDDTTPLLPLTITTPVGGTATPSGGIVVVAPYLFWFGNNGEVVRSAINNPQIIESSKNISNTKIVAAKSTAAGGSNPSVLFWSLTGLYRGTFDPTETEFSYATLSDSISILSSRCVVEYKQTYYWIGVDQFYFYNGVVNTLPNDMNRTDFFDNVNMDAAQKIFGILNRTYQEIWWFYPRGTATENTNVIIYSIELNCWFDSAINRSAGIEAGLFRFPILASSELDYDESNVGNYGIWQHEIGLNKVFFGNSNAIPSYFETAILCLPQENPETNIQFRTRRIEPDFVMSGNMTLQVNDRGFAQGEISTSPTFSFSPTTPKIDVYQMGRLVSYRFESNERDGFYQMGKIIIDWEPGDVRPNS